MLGIYFSGTGNSRYCIQTFLDRTGKKYDLCAIEDNRATSMIEQHEEIVFSYPIYYSNVPKIVRDFITDNKTLWGGKRIFIIATMAMFSGDGAGVAARLLNKHGAVITGGLHIKMPDNIGDAKFPKKNFQKNKSTVEAANTKIVKAAECYINDMPFKDGLDILGRAAGFLAQRMVFGKQAEIYHNKPDIALPKCNGCGKCARFCPTHNLVVKDDKAVGTHRCIKCYRCFSNCPQRAITILGRNVYEQHLMENYLSLSSDMVNS